jgi:hypothetical protein
MKKAIKLLAAFYATMLLFYAALLTFLLANQHWLWLWGLIPLSLGIVGFVILVLKWGKEIIDFGEEKVSKVAKRG